MKQVLRAAWEWPRVCIAAGSEYCRTGLVCLPPAWLWTRRCDPYKFYAKLRDRSPIHRSALADGVVLSRMADVAWALSDERLTSDISHSGHWQRAISLRRASAEPARPLVQMEGRDHARCRSAVIAALSESGRASFLGQARQLVANRTLHLPERGPLELITQFVFPLSRQLILMLLGIPEAYHDEFGRFMRQGLTFAFHHGESLLRYPLAMSQEASGAHHFRSEVRQAFRKLGEHPFEPSARGILPALLRAAKEDVLSLDEALVLSEEIAVASFERTAYQLGNSLLALAQRPALQQRLREEPECIPAAVRELHRFDPAVQALFRFARERLVLRHEVIQAGEPLVLLLGSANRDPRCFERPDEVDIDRMETQQLTFGKGAHGCVGAWISRTVHELVLGALLGRYASLRLNTPPEWSARIPLRGLLSLQVAVNSQS